jgi:hypothetical protein
MGVWERCSGLMEEVRWGHMGLEEHMVGSNYAEGEVWWVNIVIRRGVVGGCMVVGEV